MRNHVLGLSAGLSAVVVDLGSPVSAEKTDRRFHQDFDVQEGVKLVLHHGDGEVSIVPWEKTTIDVEVVYRASMRQARSGKTSDFEVEFDQSGDGDVRMSGIEVADVQRDGRRTSGRIGDGRGRMKISTGDGDVVLRQE